MNAGFLGAIQALNALEIWVFGRPGNRYERMDGCEVTLGAGMTTFLRRPARPGGPRQRRLLPVGLGGLFFVWRDFSAECLKACGPFGPGGAGGDHPQA